MSNDTTTTNTTTTTTTTAHSRHDAPATVYDPRPAFERASRIAVDLAADVRADQMSEPTPCTDMDVRELLRHLHMALCRAEAVATPEAAAGAPLPEEDTTIADDDLAAAIADAAVAARRRWEDDDLLSQQMTLPWTTAAGSDVLGIYLNELLVHTWDLAVATGRQPDWHDPDAELSLALIRPQLPQPDRTELWEMYREQIPSEFSDDWSAPFANAVDVADDAPAIDRLVAWCGRTPS